MKKLIELGDTTVGLDPRNQFRAAFAAAFLGVILIIAAVFWAMIAVF